MQIKPIRRDLLVYLKKRNLIRKFEKQSKLFLQDPHYPSLNTEVLELKYLKIYSFRIDKKYRVIFIFLNSETIEIVDINDHYQ